MKPRSRLRRIHRSRIGYEEGQCEIVSAYSDLLTIVAALDKLTTSRWTTAEAQSLTAACHRYLEDFPDGEEARVLLWLLTERMPSR